MEKNDKLKKNIEDILETIKGYNKDFTYKTEWIDLDKEVDRSEWNNEMLFIAFTKEGDVAVVGAGQNDIKNGKSKTKDEVEKRGRTMSTTFLIIIPQSGIEKVGPRGTGRGIENCKKSILECRNGIEMYLGEELLKNKIEIINECSHKNYSEEYWGNMKKDYKLRT